MKEKLRICVACREKHNIENLIKLKIYNNKLFLNPKSYLFGRSSYLCYNIECINKAKKHRKIEKSFRDKIQITDEIWQKLVETVLNSKQRCQTHA